MARNSRPQKGDVPALLALFGIAMLFLFIVTRGWQNLLSNYGSYISIIAAFLIAFVAVVLSWAIASERVINPLKRSTALAYFFILFNISALGTVNAMLVMFQSNNVFREEIDKAADAIVGLRDYGKRSIDTKNYDEFRSSINDKWRNLKSELENPVMCGQGPVASARIVELQQYLPNFRTLAGSGRCEKITALIISYDSQIKQLSKESKIYLDNKEKLDLIDKIDDQSANMLNLIGNIRKNLNSSYSVSDIKSQFYKISENYSLLRQEIFTSGIGENEKIQRRIDISSFSAMGDIGQILPFIAKRLDDVSTYIYLFIALILDVTLISAFARVISSGPSANQRKAAQTLRKF